MTWLIDLLFEAIQTKISQFIVAMIDLISSTFMELMSCDLNLFEELFSVVKSLYVNAIVPLGMAMLLVICLFQLFKGMFGRAGLESEDPIQLVFRTVICAFAVMYARGIVNYILKFAGTPYSWVAGTKIEVNSFSEYVNTSDLIVGTLGLDTFSMQILMLIMNIVVAWNYFKMLFVIAERYVLLGIFSYTSPLAFATGGSKATNNILASWSKMFGGQVVLIILNAWSLKVFLSGYGNLSASSTYGFTKFFTAILCLIGFSKVVFKMDSYLASLGVNLGRPSSGMGGMGLLMIVSRLMSMGRSFSGNGGTDNSGSGNSSESNGSESGPNGTIPLSAGVTSSMANDDIAMEPDDAAVTGKDSEMAASLAGEMDNEQTGDDMDNIHEGPEEDAQQMQPDISQDDAGIDGLDEDGILDGMNPEGSIDNPVDEATDVQGTNADPENISDGLGGMAENDTIPTDMDGESMEAGQKDENIGQDTDNMDAFSEHQGSISDGIGMIGSDSGKKSDKGTAKNKGDNEGGVRVPVSNESASTISAIGNGKAHGYKEQLNGGSSSAASTGFGTGGAGHTTYESGGKQYDRYNADMFEPPSGKYRAINDNGKRYYDVESSTMVNPSSVEITDDGAIKYEESKSSESISKSKGDIPYTPQEE